MATPTSSEENQEAQQSQIIAEIKGRHKIEVDAYNTTRVILDMTALLEIVDSRAQKTEQLETDISNLLNKLALWPTTYERQERQIAEQAKEITLLREVVKKMEAAFSHSQDFDRRIVAPAHAALYEYDQKAKQQ